MLMVIRVSRIFILILGWDGLGVVSFFLITYYQNQSSLVAGIFTLLINRLGDCFFVLSILTIFGHHSNQEGLLWGSPWDSRFLGLLLVLTFMTKRALFPFSPWLPIAMAAPTPISALVHSSTLVTAGLYLIIRHSHIIYASRGLTQIVLLIRIFTSLYAGINSIFEVDLKKMVALSTLRHLGFIGIAFRAGLVNLAFFHMLAHALFKSLLFMSLGGVIGCMQHSQDLRYLSNGLTITPLSAAIMGVAVVNLLGLP